MACASGVRGLCVGCVVFNFVVGKVVFPEVGFHQGTLGGSQPFPPGDPQGTLQGIPRRPPWGTLHRGQGETSADTLEDNHVGHWSGGLFVGLFLGQLWGVIKT